MANRAGYSPDEAAVIEQAALYHDIGKSDIPGRVLNKPGPLTEYEFSLIKTHTSLGYSKILNSIRVLTVAAAVCLDHHERPDGSGYNGRSGTDVHPYTRLVAVADVFDALYSKRAYKEAWDINHIRDYFKAQSGTQFDKDSVNLLFAGLDEILLLYREKNA
jgi:HD-GYP domain-containing protein (c-di-GMP phosphodiesterase class II)